MPEVDPESEVDRVVAVGDAAVDEPLPLSQKEFSQLHGGHKRELPTMRDRLRHATQWCTKSHIVALACLTFPFFTIMKQYRIRTQLPRDVVAGVTVCVMHIPQGMAYGLLAGLPPVYGLYTSLIPAVVYFLFGTSRHISVGTLAVVSLQTNAAVLAFLQNPSPPVSIVPSESASANDSSADNEPAYLVGDTLYSTEQMRMQIVVALTLLVGILQILLGVARFGFLTVYLSDSMINGFTTGLSFHIATSQIFYIFGYKPSRRYPSLFKLIYLFVDLFANIWKTNVITLALSLVCMAILVFVKEKIQPTVVAKVGFPIPIDIGVIICGIILGRCVNLAEWGVSILGPVPAGLPSVSVPNVVLWPGLLVNAIPIAIVGFAQGISMAKMFALKHGYKVDGNQELIALGASSIVGSFFNCFACSASVSRSVVLENAGCQSQLSALISSAGLMLVLLFIAPAFQTLPHFVLASIIIVALKSMMMQFGTLPKLWRTSRSDFGIWIVSCFSVVLSEPDAGLLVGLLFSLLTVIVRTQSPYACLLGEVKGTKLYADVSAYDDAEEVPGIKIFRFDGPIYFASAESFRKKLNKKLKKYGKPSKLNSNSNNDSSAKNGSEQLHRRLNNRENGDSDATELCIHKSSDIEENGVALNVDHSAVEPLRCIIIDCSSVNFVDVTGVRTLQQVISERAKMGMIVYIAGLRDSVLESLEIINFYKQLSPSLVFVTTYDAVQSARRSFEK